MSRKSPASRQPASFEAAMTELEQLVKQMESGELPLDSSIAAYERGTQLIKYCADQLENVENQVRILDKESLKPYTAAE